jgi:hypothetical protein
MKRHPTSFTTRAGFGLVALALVVASMTLTPAHAYAASTWEIVNNASGLRADVMWASTDRFQGVFLWPDNDSASQEFSLEYFSAPNGGSRRLSFHIRAAHSGQCLMLDWRSGSYENGTRVIQYPACQDLDYLPSQWYHSWVLGNCNVAWQDCQLGWHEVIVNRATDKCLDSANPRGGAPGPQAVLQQWDCIGSPDQWNAGNQFWHSE